MSSLFDRFWNLFSGDANTVSEGKKQEKQSPISSTKGVHIGPRQKTADELIRELSSYIDELQMIEKIPVSFGQTYIQKREKLHVVFEPSKIRFVWTYHSAFLQANGSEMTPRTEEQDEWIYYMDYDGLSVSTFNMDAPVSNTVIHAAKAALLGHEFASFSIDALGNITKY